MSMQIHELQLERQELTTRMRTMLDLADMQKRGLNESERKEYAAWDKKSDELDRAILDAQGDLERRRKLAEIELGGKRRTGADVDPEKEFRNVGELFYSVARDRKDGVHDARLDALREKREQTMGAGASGGYAIPEQFDAAIRQVQAALL